MSYPFLIWTVQRTGSTTLASILAHLSENKVIEHEPFNTGRMLDYQGKEELLVKQLQEIKGEKFCIKHCWNVHAPNSNQLILKHLLQDNYRIILLQRDNILAMEISRQLAKQTGIWGKNNNSENTSSFSNLSPLDISQMQKQINSYKAQLNEYKSQFKHEHIPYSNISYEQLFDGSLEKRLKMIEEVCKFLNIDSQMMKNKSQEIKELLMNYKQNNSEMYQNIPNVKEIQEVFSDYYLI